MDLRKLHAKALKNKAKSKRLIAHNTSVLEMEEEERKEREAELYEAQLQEADNYARAKVEELEVINLDVLKERAKKYGFKVDTFKDTSCVNVIHEPSKSFLCTSCEYTFPVNVKECIVWILSFLYIHPEYL